MENINKKFNELGGISFVEEKEENKNEEGSFIESVREIMSALPEQQVLDFVKAFGFAYFNDETGVVPIEPPPVVSKEKPHCPVGRFYGFGITKTSVSNVIRTYFEDDQIDAKFFPIADGEAGDIIFYSLEENTFGKIYYWHHESDTDADKFLITNTFNDFISKLEPIKADTSDSSGKAKRTSISPKMLELMNKTRAQKGLPPLTEEEALK